VQVYGTRSGNAYFFVVFVNLNFISNEVEYFGVFVVEENISDVKKPLSMRFVEHYLVEKHAIFIFGAKSLIYSKNQRIFIESQLILIITTNYDHLETENTTFMLNKR